MKRQLVIIHGGDFFDTRAEFVEDLRKSEVSKDDFLFDGTMGWKDALADELSGDGFEVFMPTMPNRLDAKYAEWKIWFERMVPFLHDGVVLVGHSLGGIFLARYLSENDLGVRASAVFLVAAPYFEKGTRKANKAGFSVGNLARLGAQAERIFILHSKDDPIMPFVHAERYHRALPHSVFVQFKDRHHFIGGKFPEIMKMIRKVG
ncbi:MAG: alpha/beta hydrolase [Candidatus Paceibacterota bacterium]|jgi:hypothetical protein